MKKIDTEKIRLATRKYRKILLELFIVFLGVYLAFQLNNYKESREADRLQRNYYDIMLNELNSNLYEISSSKKTIDTYLVNLKTNISDAKDPRIRPLLTVNLDNNMLALKSAFENGHFENLDARYISNLSLGSNLLTRVAKSISRYNDSVSDLLATNNWDNDLLYKNHQLKSKYEWLITDLESISEFLGDLEGAIKHGAIPDTEKLFIN